jgi:hypothetical protein
MRFELEAELEPNGSAQQQTACPDVMQQQHALLEVPCHVPLV